MEIDNALEEEESEDIVIADEASLPEDGKVYPKEAHPNAGKSGSRHAGLLPGGDDSDSGDSDDERNVKYFVPKFTPDVIEEYLFDLMLAVRTSVLNGTKIADAFDQIPESSFTETHSYELNRGGTDHKIYVTDYASSVFHRIRAAFGVSSSSFLLAWSANEIKSAQVEGSSLVYSCDKRFVAMPVMDRDIEILLEMLPKYYQYVKENPNTFLTKIFGLIRVHKSKKMAAYILIENVFHKHIPLHYMYHISGAAMQEQKAGVLGRMSSTLRRRSSSASKLTLSRSRGGIQQLVGGRQRSSSLLLDPPAFAKDKFGETRSTIYGNEVSWKSEGRSIMVDKNLRPTMLDQLDKDMNLLRDCGITDHKLMVGIHEGEPIAPPSPDMESKRLVKVPSIVVFQSSTTPVKASPKKGAAASPATPTPTPIAGTEFDLSNLRRENRVSIQSMDAEPQVLSPYRTVKGGLHSRTEEKEELYYIGIIDIFAVPSKDKKRDEKAAGRYTVFKDWMTENFVPFEDKNPKPEPTTPEQPAREKDASAGRLVAIGVNDSSESSD